MTHALANEGEAEGQIVEIELKQNGYPHFLPVISTCETGIARVERTFDTF